MPISTSPKAVSPDDFFAQRDWQTFDFQQQAWDAYSNGQSGLLHAPTGLGKTLAVWLGPVAEASAQHRHDKEPPCTVLWITPLRALAQDTQQSLQEPLDTFGLQWTVAMRTGDTSAYRRAKLRDRLPFALVTTPESLSLMLTYPDFREKLGSLKAVIIDEWHELLGTKRGVQTELCLARLRGWLPELRVWGLSATLGNLDQARHVLLGDATAQAASISADLRRPIEIDTVIPREIERFPWSGHLGTRLVFDVIKRIDEGDTTLLFTNTRSQTEIWFQELLAARPQWADDMAMHHGSLDREDRQEVEQRLREGRVRVVVCTSSLDLGVDFSPVDQVIQVGSPKGISRLMQRAGRSGHRPGATCKLVCVPTHAIELVEFAAARDAMNARCVEHRRPLIKPLDVLVQHMVTCMIGEPASPEALRNEVMSSHAFASLTDEEWDWALGFVTAGGKALASYPQYHKLKLVDGKLRLDDKRMIQLHKLSIGTISSTDLISIRYVNGKSLGTVEEGFISKMRPGTHFVFSGKRLELVAIRKQVASVRPATKDKQGQVAVWGGSKMPLTSQLANSLAERLHDRVIDCDEMKAVSPILDIQASWSHLPNKDSLLIEHTHSQSGEHLFVFPFAGRLVHEGMGTLSAYRLSKLNDEPIHITMNDYGFGLSAKRGLPLDEAILRDVFSPENLLVDLLECINSAELARRQFREVAKVAGLIIPQFPGKRQQRTRDLQISASLLYEVFDRYDPDNLLLEQAKREVLEKQLELSRLQTTMQRLCEQPYRLAETKRLTPMAFPLWADRLSAYLPAGDAASQLAAMLTELEQAAATCD